MTLNEITDEMGVMGRRLDAVEKLVGQLEKDKKPFDMDTPPYTPETAQGAKIKAEHAHRIKQEGHWECESGCGVLPRDEILERSPAWYYHEVQLEGGVRGEHLVKFIPPSAETPIQCEVGDCPTCVYKKAVCDQCHYKRRSETPEAEEPYYNCTNCGKIQHDQNSAGDSWKCRSCGRSYVLYVKPEIVREYDYANLKHGLYRIYWKSGGSSVASVGSHADGSRWFAPANWISPHGEDWSEVDGVKVIGLNDYLL